MVDFDITKPALGSFLASEEVRNNFEALERANELRPRPMSEVDDDPAHALKVYVEGGNYATDSQTTKEWIPGIPSTFPAFTPPATDSRTDLLYISLGGTLTIQQGVEAAIPVAPTYPADSIPIAEVTLTPLQTAIEEDDIRDVRPWFVISAAGFGINPVEQHFVVPTGGTVADRTVFTLTLFTYAPGQNEINVYSGGVRQRVNTDYTETDGSTITFLTEQPEGATISIWKVGAASAHNLSDLDDVDVSTAEAVTDPDNNRANTADRNNPFATLDDVAGAIPFSAEHDNTTGVHGPRVNIAQTGNDRALSIQKSGTGAGIAVNLENSGSDSALTITQAGDAHAIEVVQQGDADAINIAQSGTGSGLRLVQNVADNAVEIAVNSTSASVAALHLSRIVSATREPLITLEDSGGPTSGNISFNNNVLSIADKTTNTARFLFNVSTGEQTITAGGDNNRLTVSKTSAGAGDAINVTNQGTGSGIHILNQSSGRTLSLQNTGGGPDLYIAGAPNAGILDPLWGGPASNADAFHTHTSVEFLADISDVSSSEASAFNDTAAKRTQAVGATNPFAALADVKSIGSTIAFGTYTGNGTTQSITTQTTDPVTGALVSFEPDWVMIYNVSDNTRSGTYVARGAGANNGRFFTSTGSASVETTATGFDLNSADARFNGAGDTFVYIAIKGQS